MISTSTVTGRRFGNAIRQAARLHEKSSVVGAAHGHSLPAVFRVNAWLADCVLGAETAEEVSARVEEMAVSPELYERLTALKLKDCKLSPSLDRRRWYELEHRFGGAPSLSTGIRDFHSISACFAPLLEDLFATSSAEPDDDPAWFAYDPTIPPEVSAAVLDGMCGGVAFMVMEYVALTMCPIPYWACDALVSAWVPAQHHFLRFLASLPESSVPESAVPPEERFDLAQLQGQTSAYNVWASDVLSTAAERRPATPSP